MHRQRVDTHMARSASSFAATTAELPQLLP